MRNDSYVFWAIVIIAVVTRFLQFLPFWIFNGKRHRPAYIKYLGKILPYAMMSMLVVYSLRNVSVVTYPYGIPELICVLLVAILQYWRHNSLLSIASGTVLYMILVQLVF